MGKERAAAESVCMEEERGEREGKGAGLRLPAEEGREAEPVAGVRAADEGG